MPTMYIIYQNMWRYKNRKEITFEEEVQIIAEYLKSKIGEDDILLDEDVDRLLDEGDKVHFFNGDRIVLDTTLYNNNIYIV